MCPSFRIYPLLLLLLISLGTFAAGLPPGFVQLEIADELDPTRIALAPDGRVFITQKNGQILIVKDGELLPDPFLEIEVDNFNERGLGGIAIDPDFANNQYLYVYYTVPGANHNRVSRFTAVGDFGLPDSELVLLELDPLSGPIHNAGDMHFGADGTLFISAGDGTNQNNAQNLGSLLGKILRINTDGSIPADNPFFNQLSGKYRAIYALGLRNSFTFAIQPGTGRIFANDVGNADWEEINEILPGKNYGWPLVEGYIGGQDPPADYQDPFYAYSHDEGCAVIGAAFYDPQEVQFPAGYVGKYFFADYCFGYINVLDPATGEVTEVFATEIERPVGLLTAPDGSMYYLERRGIGGGSANDNTSSDNGVLWRIFYTGSDAPFVSENPDDLLLPIGEDAFFEVAALGADPLAYQWQKGGIDIPGADEPTLLVPGVSLSDDGSVFRCRVTNALGEAFSEEAVLSVTTNTRPEPVILTPLAGELYRGGDMLSFSGTATDAEDGDLDAASLTWRIIFHHDLHTHPALAPTSGIDEGAFAIGTIGETAADVWYRIYLTAEDSEGLKKTVFRDIFPEKIHITLFSQPAGIVANVDGTTDETPFIFESVVNIQRQIDLPQSQVIGNEFYLFQKWADNGSTDPQRTFLAPEQDLELEAIYVGTTLGNGTGLLGQYYDGDTHDFVDPPLLVRVDSVVNFNWGNSSADEDLFGEDFYSVRWTGDVQPLFSEEVTFHLNSDDGSRLWVDDILIIDQWAPQAPTETTGSIFLKGGDRYPIRVEFFENGGGAIVQLFWSSQTLPKTIVPQRQLYPDSDTSLVDEPEDRPMVALFPLPADEEIILEIGFDRIESGQIRLFDATGRLLRVWSYFFEPLSMQYPIQVGDLPGGLYWMEINGRFFREVHKVIVK